MRKLSEIANAAENATGLKPDSIRKPDRRCEVSVARQAYFFLARKEGYTWREIGDYVGRKHTTAYYGANLFKEQALIGERRSNDICEKMRQQLNKINN